MDSEFTMIVVLLLIACVLIRIVRTAVIKGKINKLADNALEVTPEEFFRIKNSSNGGRGKKVFQRVNNHFTGHGNGDVYADYKYGDNFTIKMIALENSGFSTLNELERNAIMAYDAYSQGYNKTRGNKG